MRAIKTMTRKQIGTSMIEVLVTLVILMLGLMGLAGLQLQAQRSEMESYQRVQALILLQDMIGRINANRAVASCYLTSSLSPAYLGTGGATAPACAVATATTEQKARATQDMTDWSNLLVGAAESGNAGTVLGGRGCISFDAATNIYLVSVAWQGLANSAAPPASLTCAAGLYSNEGMRRVVSLPLQIANLN